jgi:hypothetical protein
MGDTVTDSPDPNGRQFFQLCFTAKQPDEPA